VTKHNKSNYHADPKEEVMLAWTPVIVKRYLSPQYLNACGCSNFIVVSPYFKSQHSS